MKRFLSPALMFCAGIVVLGLDGHLFYEGSELFVSTAEYGVSADRFETPMRVAWYLMWAPLLAARLLTTDVGILTFIAGAPAVLLPVIALIFLQVLLRRRPVSLYITTIGLCLGAWPWQSFWVSPWAMVYVLGWMCIACVIRWDHPYARRCAVGLAVLLFFAHPLSAVVFIAAGVAAHLGGRGRTCVGAWLGLGAVRGLAILIESYEVRRLRDLAGISRHELSDAFGYPGAVFVAIALVCLLVAVAMFLTRHRYRWRAAGAAQAFWLLSLVAYLSVQPRAWLLSVDFHLWSFVVVPVLLVGAVLAADDSEQPPPWLAHLPAVLFAIMATASAVSFRMEVSRLQAAVAAASAPCVSTADLPEEFSGLPIHAHLFSNHVIATAGQRRVPAVLLPTDCVDRCWAPTSAAPLFDLSVLPPVTATGAACTTDLRSLIQ